jgi:hypothetical protein
MDAKTPKVKVGDWVAFMSNAHIVYGRVEYVHRQEQWPWGFDIISTAGTVDIKNVLEVRR